MRACVETYGCSLNFGEAEELEDMLLERGWELCVSPEGADLVVLVTCVVIEKTERTMLRRLRELAGVERLVVTGCMATASRAAAEAVVPDAEFVPPGDMALLSSLVPVAGPPRARPPNHPGYAIVPIASGCVGSCSYCMTRLARGSISSRPVTLVAEAVRKASAGGPVEIRLSAQDTAAYGHDIGCGLPSLVGQICDIPLDFRLRIGMMNPRNVLPIVDEVAEMFSRPKVFSFIHLPVQSGSDAVLERMARGHTREEFMGIVQRVRSRVPDVTLSTDIIVGYPGEGTADHEANMDLVRELRPDIVNVTRFSPRNGTPAACESPRVVGWTAKERSRELTELRFGIALEVNRGWVGRTAAALSTERGKPGTTILRTDQYKQVVVPEELPLGRFYTVSVEDATPTHLLGSRCDER
jgi:threonylcarbamoyladenosine tRNA methylthiotransferase CDKAL1